MIVYCVTKNDPFKMVYLGTSVKEAEEAVGRFTRYARPEDRFPNEQVIKSFSALPFNIDWEMIQFFMVDGLWYSIVMFELKESETK